MGCLGAFPCRTIYGPFFPPVNAIWVRHPSNSCIDSRECFIHLINDTFFASDKQVLAETPATSARKYRLKMGIYIFFI